MLKASPSLLSPPKVFLQCKRVSSSEHVATHAQLVTDRTLLSDIRTATRGNIIDILHRFELRCGRLFASSRSSPRDAESNCVASSSAPAVDGDGDSILPAPETFLTPSKQTVSLSAVLAVGSGVKGGATHEESNAVTVSVFSAVDNVVRCAALGSSFLRRVRQIHDTKLPLPPDELATLVVTSLEQMCTRAQLSPEATTGLLLILRGELKLLTSMYCAKSAAVLERYGAGAVLPSSEASVDYANVVAAISLMPSPVDFTFLSRYVDSVERSDEAATSRKRQREEEGHRLSAADEDDETCDIIDISPYVTVSTRDPYTLQRIVTPVRGRYCCHLQPFDALSFFKAYRKHQLTVDVGTGPTKGSLGCGGTLPCPICTKPTALTQLYVDRVLLAALQQVKGPATTLLVQRKTGAVSVGTTDNEAGDAQQSSSSVNGVGVEPLSPRTDDKRMTPSIQHQGASAQKKPQRGITIEGMSLFFDDLA